MSGFELPSNTSVVSDDGQTDRQWLQWLDRIHVICAAEQQSGSTADRPAKRLWIGRRYFDTDIGAPVFWDGSAWIEGGGGGGGLTTEQVDDRVAALLVAGSNVTLTYNDGAGTLTIASSGGGGSGSSYFPSGW